MLIYHDEKEEDVIQFFLLKQLVAFINLERIECITHWINDIDAY